MDRERRERERYMYGEGMVGEERRKGVVCVCGGKEKKEGRELWVE
jgi:hypothetical protein